MIFNPSVDPEGARAGTKGARILRIEPDRRLDFEWRVGVPSVSWDLKDTDFVTWVEVTFEPVPGRPDATRVRLVHEGFRAGGSLGSGLIPSSSEVLEATSSTGSPSTARAARNPGDAVSEAS